LHTVIVAPPRVYGPGLLTKGNPINRFIRNTLKRSVAFMPAAKEVVGNYAYIDDVVNGHFLALEKGGSGEKYILGGENVSYRKFFETIAAASGKNIKLFAVPVPLLKAWAAALFGVNFVIGRHTHLSPKVVGRLMQNRAVSCGKAVQKLGYRITPFPNGIAATIAHLKSIHAL
jgi:nucleoside-diphosphate-sugar epimerase